MKSRSAVVAWAYGFWSSKKTLMVLALITAAALFGFVWAGERIVHERGCSMCRWWCRSRASHRGGGALGHGAEIYPTQVRANGSGQPRPNWPARGRARLTDHAAAAAGRPNEPV